MTVLHLNDRKGQIDRHYFCNSGISLIAILEWEAFSSSKTKSKSQMELCTNKNIKVSIIKKEISA